MNVHRAARILHWDRSRLLYDLRGDSKIEWILERIPIVNQFVKAPRLPEYIKTYTADADIKEIAAQNGWG